MPDSPCGQSSRSWRAQRVRRFLSWAVAGTAAAVIATSGWLYHQVSGKLDSVDLHSELGTDRPEPAENAVPARTVLLLGSDSAAAGAAAEDGTDGADTAAAAQGTATEAGSRDREESDLPPAGSAMLLHLPEDGRPTAVTIPHHTRVPPPECAAPEGGKENDVSFGAVHTAGGPSCVVRVAEHLSGLRMDHYVEVDFAGFGALVDALGGLTVTTGEPIRDHGTGRELPAGAHELTGDAAMTALRSAEPAAQQEFLLALLQEVDRQDILASPAKLYRLAGAAAESLTTDSDLGSLTDLLSFVRELTADGAEDLEIRNLPETDGSGGAAGRFWQKLRTGQ